ncbi:MAG: internalization-like protein competence protein ComEC/Rec2, competence protein ComEC protein [Candidatus Paceibacter sp.]|jgi:competence protein ComEC|nr:internalization-like protein competence protein ComEC/Rec2, competence protein ComEC protein [Candidatus Paceibacter sp.]
MPRLKKHWRLSLVLAIFLANIFIWYAVAREQPSNTLTVAFLNVGQGDAIYIESPTHQQLLIDGGPSQAILGELRKVMPFYDRTIDTILVTNPDKDHYAGFIDVLDRFQVNTVIEPGSKSDTETYARFEKDVDAEHAKEIIARRGMVLDLGGGAELHILYPDHDVSAETTNDASVIAQLVYGSTTIMFTGDTTKKSEAYILSLDGTRLDSDILKVAHHGSKTSSSEEFVKAVSPQYAVISAGKNNRYGHPSPETTELFSTLKIPVLGTYNEGTIILKSDGKSFVID